MNRRMTMEEIEREFDQQWVLLGDPEKDEQNRLVGGTLLAVAPNRDSVDAALLRLRPRRSATRRVGKAAPGTALLL